MGAVGLGCRSQNLVVGLGLWANEWGVPLDGFRWLTWGLEDLPNMILRAVRGPSWARRRIM